MPAYNKKNTEDKKEIELTVALQNLKIEKLQETVKVLTEKQEASVWRKIKYFHYNHDVVVVFALFGFVVSSFFVVMGIISHSTPTIVAGGIAILVLKLILAIRYPNGF
jgi:protein-S-isoprenylcysteine O-methyltransferase Ste14